MAEQSATEAVANVLRENGLASATDDTDTIAQRIVDAVHNAAAGDGGGTGAQTSDVSETSGGGTGSAGQTDASSATGAAPDLAGTVEHNPEADPTQEPNLEG